MPDSDEHWMELALELAARGRGGVEPNPMVGAVIVKGGVELARGWHRRFGGPHAEADALAAARAAGTDLAGSTMYVTLEPCCHTNKKTPPCAQAVIASGIARVVVALEDVDPNVSGRGIAMLCKAGLEVLVGVCHRQARQLLMPYIKLRTAGRPWVICKWAQTADGYLALPGGGWVSCEESRRRVHDIRSWCDGILVGVGTVLADDPLLTNRSGAGKQPVRVVLDSRLRLPPDCRLVNSSTGVPPVSTTAVSAVASPDLERAGCPLYSRPGRPCYEAGQQSHVLVATTTLAAAGNAAHARALQACGVEVLPLPAGDDGRVSLPALLDELGRRQWTYLLVEGGEKVLRSFVEQGLADELMAFVSPRQAGPTAEHLPRFNFADVAGRPPHAAAEETRSGEDTLRHVMCIQTPH